jgi:hypothetical protein
VAEALDALRASHDLVLIEGAGSPAEINLYASDVVNMRVARHAQARCLLVADIDRGGAFAHLYGTWALLPELAPAPEMLRQRTGVPTLATLPLWRGHGLPEEDGVFDDAGVGQAQGEATRIIAIVAYPHLSNLDEFEPLRQLAALPGSGVRLRWVRDPAALGDLQPHDTLILPGSKHTAADLQWLRERRLDAAICAHAARGGRVLGICGGLQMLGEAVIDTDGLEGGPGARHANAPGLGLLPLVTDSLPVRLLPTELLSGTPIRSRDITLGDDPGINGQLWDPQRIDITAQQGTWERWTVRADRPQSFHIEGVMFQIRNVNGSSPFPEDRGWKDTVWVDGQVELLVYYAQPSWPHFPFQYLSQTLELADRGSIGQMLVNPAP